MATSTVANIIRATSASQGSSHGLDNKYIAIIVVLVALAVVGVACLCVCCGRNRGCGMAYGDCGECSGCGCPC
ncbi:hypothetical protein K491DRAFT_111960 [Lophiostoma macrostomum CBS 122681]|uniref:Uncharacterized protein n=1 Tax=Lophiostoma macrostomum CBS 122681 TaxID=1314788 RepID=A0A6A6SVC0_9PLEO|nr:hypothetical protein K491DRAFT_111960 [Lophiostoma macrostomum CBS 122681]